MTWGFFLCVAGQGLSLTAVMDSGRVCEGHVGRASSPTRKEEEEGEAEFR